MTGLAYFLGGRIYDFLDEHFETKRYAKIRRSILENLGGKILDAGCGTGRNFYYYNEDAKVVGVAVSENMLEVARERAENSKANIKVKRMNLAHLKFNNDAFDYVMASFVLCVMPEETETLALKELIRVSKPGARLYFLEYVYSKSPFRRYLMPRILEKTTHFSAWMNPWTSKSPKTNLGFQAEVKRKDFLMKATSFIPKLLYSIRFNTTFSLIKEEEALEIEKLAFVYDDVVRLIVAKKIKSG